MACSEASTKYGTSGRTQQSGRSSTQRPEKAPTSPSPEGRAGLLPAASLLVLRLAGLLPLAADTPVRLHLELRLDALVSLLQRLKNDAFNTVVIRSLLGMKVDDEV